MPTALTDIETREVSVVDNGAVRRRFAMRKRDAAAMDDIIKNCLELDLEPGQAEAIEKLTTDAKAKQGISGGLKVLNAFKDHLTGDHVKAMANMAGLKHPDEDDDNAPDGDSGDGPDDDGDADSDSAKAKAKSGKGAATKKRDDNVRQDSISPAVQARLDAIQKQADTDRAEKVELKKALEAERDARLTRECIEKASKEYPMLGDSKEVGKVIKQMRQQGVFGKEIEQFLKAANEKASQAALFSQRGESAAAPDSGSASDRLNQATMAIAKRDNVSTAKAMDTAISEDPSLYEEYRNEQQRRVREGA